MKKKSNKIVLLLFKIVILILIIVAITNIGYNYYEKELLEEEFSELMKYDLNKDNFETKIKTDGNYANVEISIKKYLNDYRKQNEKISNLRNNQQLKSVLSAANYSSDGPLFQNTNDFLIKYQEQLSTEVEKLTSFQDENVIDSYGKDLDDNYFKIYKKYIASTNLKETITANINEINNTKKSIDKIVEDERKVIEFLKTTNSWVIRNDQIIFSKEEDLNTYNELTKDIGK